LTWARGVIAFVALCKDTLAGNEETCGQLRGSCIRIVGQLGIPRLLELVGYLTQNFDTDLAWKKPVVNPTGYNAGNLPDALRDEAVKLRVPKSVDNLFLAAWCSMLWTSSEWSANAQ